jgi:hypothetical protein
MKGDGYKTSPAGSLISENYISDDEWDVEDVLEEWIMKVDAWFQSVTSKWKYYSNTLLGARDSGTFNMKHMPRSTATRDERKI